MKQDSLDVKINIYNRQKALTLSKGFVRKAVKALFSFLSISCEEISIYFVTDEEISQLHAQFFNDPTPTDCITFPMDALYLGDIFISPAAAIRYAPEDPQEETVLYIVHGLLHLVGYDDLLPKKRRTMRKMEKRCMDHLKEVKIL